MGLAIVHTRARVGVHAPEVRVEVHLAGGLPAMSIVGLPEAAVREAKDRVRAAILCAQFEFPARRITINLAPSGTRKMGSGLDLAMAVELPISGDRFAIRTTRIPTGAPPQPIVRSVSTTPPKSRRPRWSSALCPAASRRDFATNRILSSRTV